MRSLEPWLWQQTLIKDTPGSKWLLCTCSNHVSIHSYYEWMRGQFKSKRATLETGLRSVGIDPLPSRGGFFLMGRLPSSIHKADCRTLMEPEDWQLCRALATHYGIVAIPASPFFSSLQSASEYGPMARFAFCKQDETLAEATNRLISMSTGNKIIHPFGMKWLCRRARKSALLKNEPKGILRIDIIKPNKKH